MKKLFALALIVAFLLPGILRAQDPQSFRIHEIVVAPSKDPQFREAAKKLIALCKQHKTSFGFSGVGYDDGSYIFLSPMNKFAELDGNAFGDLQEKIGAEAMGKVWAAIDECAVSSRDVIATMLPEFSYMGPPPADQNARLVTFWAPIYSKQAEAEALFREWKKLAESRKSPDGYIVYRAGFGNEQPGYAIVSWGKDQVDIATKAKKNQELNGEDGQKLWLKTQAITKSYYTKRAWIMPELSYTPAK